MSNWWSSFTLVSTAPWVLLASVALHAIFGSTPINTSMQLDATEAALGKATDSDHQR